MSDFLKPNPEHIGWDHYVALHREISSCRTQVRVMVQEHRFKKSKELKINGVPAKHEDLRWAFHVFYASKQEPDFASKVFDGSERGIKKAIEQAEEFLRNIKKRLNGVKIPTRPPEVDEWLKR